jgi:hypothetical protein
MWWIMFSFATRFEAVMHLAGGKMGMDRPASQKKYTSARWLSP